MQLTETSSWKGRRVRWGRAGTGPNLVLCHGTPWSSAAWGDVVSFLSQYFTVTVWDMPGYGQSSKVENHDTSLAVQSELLDALLKEWNFATPPHILAHDIGGAIALRTHLIHENQFETLLLVDPVALSPWGSDFFELVKNNVAVFNSLPVRIHQAVVCEYIKGAASKELDENTLALLCEPWLSEDGQHAFYKQMQDADERYTDEFRTLLPGVTLRTKVIWGRDDEWIPASRAYDLAAAIPHCAVSVIDDAGHLVFLDQKVAFTRELRSFYGIE